MARRPSSVRPSVRPFVNFCANRFFSQANGRISTKLAHDGLQVSVHPRCAQGQGQGQGQRSRDTGTFVLARKSLLLPGKWPDRDQTCTRWSPGKPAFTVCSMSRSRSKVTWYAHFLGFLEWATPSLTVWFKVSSKVSAHVKDSNTWRRGYAGSFHIQVIDRHQRFRLCPVILELAAASRPYGLSTHITLILFHPCHQWTDITITVVCSSCSSSDV